MPIRLLGSSTGTTRAAGSSGGKQRVEDARQRVEQELRAEAARQLPVGGNSRARVRERGGGERIRGLGQPLPQALDEDGETLLVPLRAPAARRRRGTPPRCGRRRRRRSPPPSGRSRSRSRDRAPRGRARAPRPDRRARRRPAPAAGAPRGRAAGAARSDRRRWRRRARAPRRAPRSRSRRRHPTTPADGRSRSRSGSGPARLRPGNSHRPRALRGCSSSGALWVQRSNSTDTGR